MKTTPNKTKSKRSTTPVSRVTPRSGSLLKSSASSRAPGEHEASTIGIVLCSEKNDAMVKITLPKDNAHILAASYQMYLPTEEELRAELAREREAAERALRLTKDSDDGKA